MCGSISGASEIIFVSPDVVFPEIIARLYLYEYEIRFARVLNAVQVTARDVDGLSRL